MLSLKNQWDNNTETAGLELKGVLFSKNNKITLTIASCRKNLLQFVVPISIVLGVETIRVKINII